MTDYDPLFTQKQFNGGQDPRCCERIGQYREDG